MPDLRETLVEVADPVLELDELWSFVLKKTRKRWMRTLSFSKSEKMHGACLRLFIHRYNCNHALTLM